MERLFGACGRIFLLGSLIFSTPVAADPAGEPIPSVPVDLSSSVFQEHLPFDVEFLIVTPSDVSLQHVKVTYGDKQCLADCKAGCDSKCKKPALTEWRRNASTKADSPVQIQIPPLRARARYVFTFDIERKPSDTEILAFRTRARGRVDDLFRKEGRIMDLHDEDDLRPLRRDLDAAVVRNPQEHVQHGLFAGKTDEEIFLDFKREMAGIIGAQDAKFDAADGFLDLVQGTEDQPGAERKLSDLLAADSSLVQLVLTLRQKTAEGDAEDDNDDKDKDKEAIKSLLSSFQGTMDFIVNPPTPARLLVRGETEPGAEPIEDLWEASAVDLRVTNIQGTLRMLNAVERLVDLVARTPLLRQASGMTGSQLNDLGADVRAVRFDLEAILTEAQEVASALRRRTANIAEYVERLELRLREMVVIAGSTDAEFETQHSWYVAADLGVGVAPRIDKVVPYVGTNIYFRPVNKSADLGDPRLEGSIFWRRFSVMLGATIQDIHESGQREGLFANRGFILGGGLRLNRSIRVSAGSLLFREIDPNPLITKKSLAGTYFLSLSFDWDVRETFGDFGKAIGLTE